MSVEGEMSTHHEGNLAQRSCAVRFFRAFTLTQPGERARVYACVDVCENGRERSMRPRAGRDDEHVRVRGVAHHELAPLTQLQRNVEESTMISGVSLSI